MKKIYLIRHGQTHWNSLGKTQGQEADIKLNDVGIKQSIQTGKYLKKFRFEKNMCIVSSPMKRASKTAELIAQQLDMNPSNITYLAELMEVKKGTLSGMTWDDSLVKQFRKFENLELEKIIDPIEREIIQSCENNGKFYDDLIKKYSLPISGVESHSEIVKRVLKIVEFIQKSSCESIVLVSHSGFLHIFLQHVFRLNVVPRGNMKFGTNCSICYCELDDKENFYMKVPQNTLHLGMMFD